MKKISLLVLILFLCSLTVSTYAAGEYRDGVYVGYVDRTYPEYVGLGDCVIEVVIAQGKIADVDIINPFKLNYHSYKPGKDAFFEFPHMILESQSTDVEIISGATRSSKDYIKAIDMALSIADGSYQGNKYYGVSRDYENGHVLTEITVEDNKITAARIIPAFDMFLSKSDGRESIMPAKEEGTDSEAVFNYYINFGDLVVQNQGKVDIVSGAESCGYSYNAALEMALKQAGL
ncbi:MAG: FMN-binding protein [bacterium]